MLKEVTIALVGKYTKLEDAYASVLKALNHAAMAVNHKLNLKVSGEIPSKRKFGGFGMKEEFV